MANHLKKRGLALLMTLIMALSLIPVNALAEGGEGSDSGTQVEETVSDVPSDGEQADVPGDGEQADVPGDGEQADVPGDGEQADVPGDGEQTTDPTAPVDPAAPVVEKTPEELAAEEAARQAAAAQAAAAAAAEAAAQAAAAEAARQAAFAAAHPEITGEATYNDTTVYVTAPVGAFAAGTTLSIEPVKNGLLESVVSAVKGLFGAESDTTMSALLDSIQAAAGEDEQTTGAVAFDITFTDADGNEVQPDSEYPVDVRFEVASNSELVADGEQLQVFHMETAQSEATPVGESVEIDPDAQTQTVAVSADSFSVYVVTVRKENASDKNDKKYTIRPGQSFTFTNGHWPGQEHTWTIEGSNPGIIITPHTPKQVGNNWEQSIDVEVGKDVPSGVYRLEHQWTDPGAGTEYFVIHIKSMSLTITDDISNSGCLTVALPAGVSAEGVTYKWYRGENESSVTEEVTSNVSAAGTALNVALDGGARKWYQAEAYQNGALLAASDPYQVPYYAELQNGDFEKGNQFWNTTASDHAIEIGSYDQEMGVYGTQGDKSPLSSSSSNDKFAELNANAAGSLYQDVLTLPHAELKWRLAHRARSAYYWNDEPQYLPSATDTMYVVIMSSADATKLLDSAKSSSQQEVLKGMVDSVLNGADSITNATYSLWGAESVTATVKKITTTSTLEDKDGSYSVKKGWSAYENNAYTVPDGQYATRFFFVAGDTQTGDKTVGNLLDDVWFSTQTPPPAPPAPDTGNLTVTKTVTGLENGTVIPAETFTFTVTGTDGDTVSGTVKLPDSNITVNGTSTVLEGSLPNIAPGDYTVSESSEDLLGYQLTSQPVGQTVKVEAGATAEVGFTNDYEQIPVTGTTTVTIIKTWDDDNNAAGARPTTSVDVTLTPDSGDPVHVTLYANQDWTGTATVDRNTVYDLSDSVKDYAVKDYSYTKESISLDGELTPVTNCNTLGFDFSGNCLVAKKGNSYLIWTKDSISGNTAARESLITFANTKGFNGIDNPNATVNFVSGGSFSNSNMTISFTNGKVTFVNQSAWSQWAQGTYVYTRAKAELTNTYTLVNDGEITINKSFGENNATMDIPAGATFNLYKGNDIVDTARWSDFNSNSYTFKDLAPGTYKVVETNAGIGGYTLDTQYGSNVILAYQNADSSHMRHVNARAVTVTNTYSEITGDPEYVPATLTINKQSNDETPVVLPGAVFELKPKTGSDETRTTGSNGSATFTFGNGALPEGTYTLQEKTAPTGFDETTDTWIVNVTVVPSKALTGDEFVTTYTYGLTVTPAVGNNHSSVNGNTVTVTNARQMRTITVTKVFSIKNELASEDNMTGLPQYFNIGNTYNPSESFTVANAMFGDGSSENPYTWTLTVPYETKVTFTEYNYTVDGYNVKTTVGGVDKAVSGDVTATQSTNSILFQNAYEQIVDSNKDVIKPTELKILKQNKDETPLGGATFELTTASKEVVSYGTTVAGELTLNIGADYLGKDTDKGYTFILTETAAPTGYQLGGPWTVKVTTGGVTVEKVDATGNAGGFFHSIFAWLVGSTTGEGAIWDAEHNILTVTDKAVAYSLTVHKTVTGPDSMTNKAGTFLFDVYTDTDHQNCLTTEAPITVTTNAITGEGTSDPFTVPSAGTYYVVEQIPAGDIDDYESKLKTAPQTTVTLDSSFHTATVTGTAEITNTYTLKTGEVKFQKTYDGSGISGAEFTLYTDEGCTEQYGKDVYPSDNNGLVTMELPYGTYFMKETKTADNGYAANDTVYKIEVGEKGGEPAATLSEGTRKTGLAKFFNIFAKGENNKYTELTGNTIANYRVINWYVNLAGDVLDYTNQVKGWPTSLFTTSVASAAGSGFTVLAGDKTDPGTTSENIFNSISSIKLTNKSPAFNESNFPSDAEVLKELQDTTILKGNKLYAFEDPYSKNDDGTTTGTPVDLNDLNTDNYEIYWYVVKNHSDGWHVDGVLSRKTADLTVTKTFTFKDGDSFVAAENLIPENTFRITLTGEDGTVQTLGLTGVAGVQPPDGTSPEPVPTFAPSTAESDTQTGSVTYIWTVEGLPTGGYTIAESGYGVEDYDLPTAKLNGAFMKEEKENFNATLPMNTEGSYTAALDNTYTRAYRDLTVTKTTNHTLPADFQITVAGEGRTYTLDLTGSEAVPAPTFDSATNTYTWTLSVPTGNYTAAESNYLVPGYSVAVTATGAGQYDAASKTDSFEVASAGTDEAVAVNFINSYTQNSTPYVPGGGGDGGGGNDTPVVISDNPTPLNPTPGTTTEIPDGEVPQTDIPGTEIPDENVPLALAPSTGDSITLWVMAAAVSGIGLVWLAIAGRKRRDDDAR